MTEANDLKRIPVWRLNASGQVITRSMASWYLCVKPYTIIGAFQIAIDLLTEEVRL